MSDYAKQPRRKFCQFCKEDTQYIDYKDTQMLRKYVTDRGKIKPRRVTGACTQHQRDIANYLLPQKVAILATKGNLKQLEQRKHNIAKREENRLADAGKIKETLDGALVKVEAKVGEEGQLFGSVTAQMIADAIKAATDVDVDRRRIELGHAIKTAGQHEVTISLYRDIKTTVKLFVGGADDEVAPAEAEVVEETIEEVVEAPAEETAEAAE